MSKKIAVLRGDGIGPEIVNATLDVLNVLGDKYSLDLTFEDAAFGGAAIDQYGSPFPEETKAIVKNVDAVLLGSVGGPKYDALPREQRPETGLLAIRKELGLYCNLRPAKYYDFLADRLVFKKECVEGVDIVICRELTSGIYFGEKKRNGDEAYDMMYYNKGEITRIVRDAFELAKQRPAKHLTSVDKANVLETSRLWREVVNEMAAEYPEVTVDHMYVDNAAVQLVLNPKQFDVIVTENSFGDILSDESAALAGSLGMVPSASLGGNVGLYEPAHGSAPDIAGQGIANPIATMLSAAYMLRMSLDAVDAAQSLENAVQQTIDDGFLTVDIAADPEKAVDTKTFTQKVIERLA
ncbi:MAG: 3-isopropylmalate dehydrogenase [Peptococcaceae bacterium]|nr:3-isopropylmalate dehydrogenase [Peptococcaceae bacterium]